MGLPRLRFTVSHPIEPDRSADLELLVDTGAMDSIVPRSVLESLGVQPQSRRTYRLANGQTIERDVSIAGFRWNGHMCGATVLFGEPGDEPILGVTALESMGLKIDPKTGTLEPTDLLLI